MTLILFVCRGNTCRSPMAEMAARSAARRAGLGDVLAFASAGVAPSAIGAPADPRAIACVRSVGLDLTGHQTRAVTGEILGEAHQVFALDRSVRAGLRAMAPGSEQRKIELLMELAPELGMLDVDDPWSGTAQDYERAFALITAAVDALVKARRW